MKHYLRWSKEHRNARFSLVASGVPPVQPAELGLAANGVSLEVRGTYGDPLLIDTIATLYGTAAHGIVPVPGTSSANFIALAATVPCGSRVLIESPTYEPLLRVAEFLRLDVVPIHRRGDRDFGLDLDELEAGLRSGAKAMVLTNLHNPSGGFHSAGAVREISQACHRTDAAMIVDEVYLDAYAITRSVPRWTAVNAGPNVVATGSLTKVYGLGSLRVGWLLAHPDVAERARHVVDLLSVENPAPSGSLALHALGDLSRLEQRYRRFHRNGQAVFRPWLAAEPHVHGYENHGALFEWLRLPEGVSSKRLAELLAGTYETQIVPGEFFGCDDHVRISTALPPAELREALSRIAEAIRTLVERRTPRLGEALDSP